MYETKLENSSEQAQYVLDVSAAINDFNEQLNTKLRPDSHQQPVLQVSGVRVHV